jgi:hypothetical protein
VSLSQGIVIPPIANTNRQRGNDFVMSRLQQREVGRIRITVERDKPAGGKKLVASMFAEDFVDIRT